MTSREEDEPLFSQASVPLSGSDEPRPTPLNPSSPIAKRGEGSSLVGERLGSYLLERELGQGTFGRVYLACDTHTDRQVAIKVREGFGELGLSEGFLHEAKSIARLEHPNIVRLMHVDETNDGIGYIVYEYVEGETLEQHTRPTLSSVPQVVEWIASIADALEFAHRNGVIHRDISPRNIMVSKTGHGKLLDFGLSRLDGAFHTQDKDCILGTPHFMSPEQASGKPHWATAHSDLFSLGSVLYYTLTGKPPFPGTSALDILERIQSSTPAPPRSLREGLSIGLEQACLKVLSKEPHQRFSTGGDFAKALRKSIASSKVTNADDSTQGGTWPIVLGGALLLIGIGCIFGAWKQFYQSKHSIVPERPSPIVNPFPPPTPKILSCDIKVLPSKTEDKPKPLQECLPLPPETYRLSVTAEFSGVSPSSYKYLLVFNQAKEEWHSKQILSQSESINPSEIQEWLQPGANMILVCATDQQITDETITRVPFTKRYLVEVSDIKRYTISYNDEIADKFSPKEGAIVLANEELPFDEIEIDHSFKQELLDLKFQAYFGVIFGKLGQSNSN